MAEQRGKDSAADQGSSPGATLAKYIVIIIGILALTALVFFGGQIWFVYSTYEFCVNYAASLFGVDVVFSRLFAVLVTSLLILALPTLLGFVFLGRNRKQVLVGAMLVYTAFSVALFFGAKDVFFDRTSGLPGKFVIETLDGFKFSNTQDIDPKWGIRYKPITPEILRRYHFWKKNGRNDAIPLVQPGKYFDMLTGEPIVWYTERQNGEIILFSLPGHDQKTGKVLKPITSEMVDQYEQYLKRREELAELTKRLEAEKTLAKSADNVVRDITIVGKLSSKATLVANFELQPEQSTDSWYCVQDGLVPSFNSDGPGFNIIYQDGEIVRVQEEGSRTPIIGRPGQFKIQAQGKPAKVTFLINKTSRWQEEAVPSGASGDNTNPKPQSASRIVRWTDQHGVVHYNNGNGYGEYGVQE